MDNEALGVFPLSGGAGCGETVSYLLAEGG